ncbi:MAG: amidohydrolase family protein, partial [Planctomycetota bacterium]|nr:amidohydrolase family protein [Planctomycetota bacterium]
MAASSDITTIRARFIWAGPGRVHAPGEIVIAHGRIVSIRRLVRRARVLDCAVFPGLVNAHAHLQLGRLGHVERRFLPWVRAVMPAARETSRQDLARRAQRSIRSLVRSGTTAVGEIDSTGLSSAELRSTGLAGRCYQELLGHDLGPQAARRELISRGVQGSRPCPAGWSPHAPYSVSPALFRAAARSGLPLMVHAAETEEEMQFLHTGRGPFRDLLEELGRIPPGFKPARLGAVRWLDRLGVLDSSCAVVHAQHLEEGEAELLHRH